MTPHTESPRAIWERRPIKVKNNIIPQAIKKQRRDQNMKLTPSTYQHRANIAAKSYQTSMPEHVLELPNHEKHANSLYKQYVPKVLQVACASEKGFKRTINNDTLIHPKIFEQTMRKRSSKK